MNSLTISDVEREVLLTDAESVAWVFDQAEIWTPSADTSRMNGPAVAKMIRALITAAQKSERDSVIEECAKVAERRRRYFVGGPDVRQYVSFCATEAGAAIRNLKTEVAKWKK